MNNAQRATCWSLTINMGATKMETIEEWIHSARAKGWKITGQVEKAPTTGTLHYQLMLRTPQMRFSAIKRAFPTAHIEIAKRQIALAQYVVKTDTRVAGLPQEDEKYPTAAKFWGLVFKTHNTGNTDGWDESDESAVRFYDDQRQKQLEANPLAFLDQTAADLIRRGYVIDHLITNPAIRSFWNKFHGEVLYRTRAADRQTDRQKELLDVETQTDATSDSRGEDASESEAQSTTGTETGSEDTSDGDRESDAGTSDGEQDGWFQR